jgi:hypothetical protein
MYAWALLGGPKSDSADRATTPAVWKVMVSVSKTNSGIGPVSTL